MISAFLELKMHPDPRFQIYSFREHFDYYSYLEQQSHFDNLALAVDASIRKSVASNRELQNRNIHLLCDIQSQLDSGFETLSIDINSVRDSVDNVAWICSEGFAKLALELNSIGTKIESIKALTKNPSRTWAYEQFNIAKESYLRNNFEEALSSITLALNGHESQLGYKLDHRFYMLRGLIRLGNNKNFSKDIVDLEEAFKDFLTASEYAKSAFDIYKAHPADPKWITDHEEYVQYSPDDYKSDQARSLGLAGWARYCAGDFEGAACYLTKCVETRSEDWRDAYDLAKVRMRLKKEKEALEQLVALLSLKPEYAMRAGADLDFLENRSVLESAIHLVRAKAARILEEFDCDVKNLLSPNRLEVIEKHSLAVKSSDHSFIYEFNRSKDSVGLVGLIEAQAAAPKELQSIKDALIRSSDELENRAKAVEEETKTKNKDRFGDQFFSRLTFGHTIVTILVIMSVFISILSEPNEGPIGKILATGVLLIVGVPFTYLIIAPLVMIPIGGILALLGIIRSSSEEKQSRDTADQLRRDAKTLKCT
jgi:tetratricopeptide (TPR) repeat protein